MSNEKKYNEALERAKKVYEDNINEPNEVSAVLKSIFPELESEDDRVIRILKKVLYDTNEGVEHMIGDKAVTECIDWLEKHRTVETPKWMLDFLDEHRRHFGTPMEHEERRDVDSKLLAIYKWLQGNPNIEGNGSNSWSENDIGIFLSIKCVIDEIWHANDNDFCGYSKEELEEMWNWLDVVWKKVKYPDDSKQLTENDIEHINSILERLDGMCQKGATFTRTHFAVSEDIDWLKGVRPHSNPRWTPTNEQMRELYTMMCECRPADQQLLQDLYFGLKDLKGE